jgi:uncharacterized DUF497 family protein
MDATGTLLVVSHTFILESDGSAQVRLISARRATKKEFETYLKGA